MGKGDPEFPVKSVNERPGGKMFLTPGLIRGYPCRFADIHVDWRFQSLWMQGVTDRF